MQSVSDASVERGTKLRALLLAQVQSSAAALRFRFRPRPLPRPLPRPPPLRPRPIAIPRCARLTGRARCNWGFMCKFGRIMRLTVAKRRFATVRAGTRQCRRRARAACASPRLLRFDDMSKGPPHRHASAAHCTAFPPPQTSWSDSWPRSSGLQRGFCPCPYPH